MPHMTNFAETGVLNHIFRSPSFPKPSTLAVALTRAVPTDSQTGATIDEVPNSNGYARVNLGAPSDSLFSIPAQDGAGSGWITNLSAISFPAATATWGWCSGISILDSATHGAGNAFYNGPLEEAQLIQNGTTFTIPSGSLRIFQH